MHLLLLGKYREYGRLLTPELYRSQECVKPSPRTDDRHCVEVREKPKGAMHYQKYIISAHCAGEEKQRGKSERSEARAQPSRSRSRVVEFGPDELNHA